jgi:hypothetical protein
MKKRALALVCAFAMGMTMCAGTNVSNTAKAAADGSTETVENEGTDVSDTETVTTPKVRIVGATISNQNGSTQSLRFLMEVENYDQIKVSEGQDFGINLTVADKTVPVTYKKYNKIYAVDKTSNTLQYAVEINGINSDNIKTDIIAQGFVTGLPSEGGTVDNVATSEKATRSVSGVATAAGYKITVDNNKNMTLNKNFGTECSLDLSKAQVLYGKGTIECDSFSGAIKAKNVDGITVPIHDKGFVVGSDVEVTIHGTASGSGVRAWIAQNDKDKATEIYENVTMDSKFPLKINASVASSLLYIKPSSYTETFDELNISKIDVKVLPFAKPAVAPAPYKLEFNDETVKKGSKYDNGNAVINEDETVTGTITSQYGNFGFALPDNLVSNYYDTVTVKFKDANYQGKPEANIWMALDTVNNGLLTEEIEYNDRFQHLTEGEAVITAKSGPIKNVRILTGDTKPTEENPFTFKIESVIFSNSEWINPDDIKDEYELELNKANVVAVNKQVDLTFNADKSVTIATTADGGEFGFKIPRNIYQANDFRKITISYKDSDLTEHLHYTQHYGTDVVGWNGKDNSQRSNISVMGEGTVTLNLSPATEDGNFSNMRFFDLVKGKKITITSVKLTK